MENCQKCYKNFNDSCDSCDMGFKKSLNGCEKCGKANCSMCFNFQSLIFKNFRSWEVCKNCNHGFGFKDGSVGATCTPCGPSCVSCNRDNNTCEECATEHFLNPETSTCFSKTDSLGCYSWDFKTDKCQSCNRGYFLHTQADAQNPSKVYTRCSECSKIVYGCQTCRPL